MEKRPTMALAEYELSTTYAPSLTTKKAIIPNLSNPTSQAPRPPQLPTYLAPNPNIKHIQRAYTNEAMQYPTYRLEVSDVHLKSRKQLDGPSSP